MNASWEFRKSVKPIPNKKYRDLLLLLYGYKCAYCGTKLDDSFHADHIKSYYHGGKTTINNMCASCRSCNLEKSIDDWSDKYNEPNLILKYYAYLVYILEGHFKLTHLI